ncbi:apolipoprotein N-acyltransferase [Mycobacterium shimoidei]|uniref:apolipoprotein N-acyltransferase n=1 Tax=Mycobacterium shimoidei TaxID=29313 RepID=UPI000848891A|nr:apolipoprotein N-acyltransferase [Mycobacterium shimoidei]MCV7260717.1 apolipoprotein N-acyltransferase [Mycobacterium shimoidei]ODR07875.1 apolipoprotein N-acyltransferase [Mycobacterium shimoidei]ORW80285.1 apolipoprotein N-acyltransferase [Mycobacterium shimoidei]
MADRERRFSRRGRFDDVTEIIPAVDVDDTGDVPIPDADDDESPSVAARLGAAARRQLGKVGPILRERVLPKTAKALRPRATRLGATIASGLLLCASFPPTDWWWAAVVAFALLAWVLTRAATRPVGGFGYGFLLGLVFYLPLLPWIAMLVGAIPWIALATVSAVFPGIFGLLAVAVRRLPGWPVWFAAAWAVQEWLKSSVPFGGFPWGVVAFGQTSGPFLPLVRLGGPPLLSLAIVLLGSSLTAIAVEIVSWWHKSRRLAADTPPAVLVPAICICAVLFASVAVWPAVRRSGAGAGDEPTVTVAAVQGNVPRLGLDFNSQRRAVLDNHVRETLRLADDVHAGSAPQPQFVVWPEDASDIDPLANPDAGQQMNVAADAIGAPILVGTVLDVPKRPPDDPAYTNTVIVWNPVTGPGERHDKQIVQPFGEYLPWPGFFRHLSRYAEWAGHFVPGQSSGVVHAAGIPVGVATCWEVIFDRAARESVRNGAQILAMPSNNATFNQAMSEQQLAFDKVRAVEHDRYVVVAGTVGISAVIAPDGGELERTAFFQPAYLVSQVRLKTALTPATRWGDILGWVLVVAGIGAVFAGILHNGWFMRPNRRRLRSAKQGAPAADRSDDDTAAEHHGRDAARRGPDRGAI